MKRKTHDPQVMARWRPDFQGYAQHDAHAVLRRRVARGAVVAVVPLDVRLEHDGDGLLARGSGTRAVGTERRSL